MPRKSGSSKSNSNTRPMTRSRSGAIPENNIPDVPKDGTNKVADLTYYTKMNDPSRNEVSKAGMSSLTSIILGNLRHGHFSWRSSCEGKYI